MDNKKPAIPAEKGYDKAHELSYQIARDKILADQDLEGQCTRSGAELQTTGAQRRIVIPFLGRKYCISLPEVEISLLDSDEPVPMREKLLILHYFVTARGSPSANRQIAFREIPEGPVYFPTFAKRTIKPLVDNFGSQPERLTAAGDKLGGRKVDYADAAVAIDAFPRVTITLVVWRGDDEFPSEANVLFDANVRDYLPAEDVTILCETIIWKLVRSLS